MKIKILITYKEHYESLKSDILIPIQSGRALSKIKFPEMIGDDTGNNISKDNDKFSELSALYWAWKNYDKLGNPDYIGHMHYRRYFIFDDTLEVPQNKWISSFYYINSLDEVTAYINDKNIKNTVMGYDILIPKWHVTPTTNIRQEYIKNIPGSRKTIFDTFISICRRLHPDFEEEILKVEKGNIVSICHMFIMKKEIFFDYCKFAFPVLFELEKEVDLTGLDENGMRFCGYMGEKLQTIYIFHLMKWNENLKIRYLNALFVTGIKKLKTHDKSKNNIEHLLKHFNRLILPWKKITRYCSEFFSVLYYLFKCVIHKE